MKYLSLLGCIFIICGCASNKLVSYQQRDSDFIKLMVSEGSNPNKEHWVNYFFDCKSKSAATEVSQNASSIGYEGDYVSYSKKYKSWTTSIDIPIKLNLEEISFHRAKLMPLIPKGAICDVTLGANVTK